MVRPDWENLGRKTLKSLPMVRHIERFMDQQVPLIIQH